MGRLIRISVSDAVYERFHTQLGRKWRGEKILVNGLSDCENIEVEKKTKIIEKKVSVKEKRKINFKAFPKLVKRRKNDRDNSFSRGAKS